MKFNTSDQAVSVIAATLLAVLSSTLILVIAFVTEPWAIRTFGDPLDRAMPLLEPDQFFGWRQRSNLSADFFGAPVWTDSNGFRVKSDGQETNWQSDVLIFGPSSAFGWGVSAESTYSYRLIEILRNQFGNQWTSANVSEIGYSTWQGNRLVNAILPRFTRSKVVVLGYGINDLDHFRFFNQINLSDQQALANTRTGSGLSGLGSLATGIPFFSMAIRALETLEFNFSCGYSKAPVRRVSDDEILANYSSMIDSIRNLGKEAVLLDTAFFLGGGSDLPLVQEKANESERLYAASAEANKQGDCSNARSLFKKARALEQYRIARDVFQLNESLAELAEAKKLSFIKVSKLLIAGDESNLNFIDPVHPSALGHSKIAESLAPVIVATAKGH